MSTPERPLPDHAPLDALYGVQCLLDTLLQAHKQGMAQELRLENHTVAVLKMMARELEDVYCEVNNRAGKCTCGSMARPAWR